MTKKHANTAKSRITAADTREGSIRLLLARISRLSTPKVFTTGT
jgi:hypothetical protein